MPKEAAILDNYPVLREYTEPLKAAEREIVGREEEKKKLRAAMSRPEICNCILIAEPGGGKTALVQGAMLDDIKRVYLTVNLERMMAGLKDANFIAERIKSLFDEAERYAKNESIELVFFIDEFHRILQLSDSAVEALKPVLAESGARGLRIIAATTNEEFFQYVAPNQPLVERLQRINLTEPDRKTTLTILKGVARRYGVDHLIHDDMLYGQIYDLTTRYIPAQSQPRKSLRMLDSMIGWHKEYGRKMDYELLADVMYDSEQVNIAFRVDAVGIEKILNERVISQKFATKVIAQRLQLSVAGMNDPTKPMASFLFTGATGVGKALVNSTRIPVYTEDGSVSFKTMGDLVEGDKVFGRLGQPTEVIGKFPQGMRDAYRMTLDDGRVIDADGLHLWPVCMPDSEHLEHMTTSQIMRNMLLTARYFIPMNEAVRWVDSTDDEGMGSVSHRQQELNRLFGTVEGEDVTRSSKLSYAAASFDEAEHVRELLFSMGIQSVMSAISHDDDRVEYSIRIIDSDTVGIKSIEKLDEQQEMSCILVDDPEHLFLAGQYVVTHNTEITKQLAQILFGDAQRHLIRFDMAEYALEDSVDRLRSELTRRVGDRQFSVVLFDEIEKANPVAVRLLLSVLDDARLTNDYNREVSFKNCYIVLTTNAAQEIYKNTAQYDVDKDGTGEGVLKYMKVIRRSLMKTTGENKFPPELVNRIDAIVPFSPLSDSTQYTIVSNKMADVRKQLYRQHGVKMDVNPKVLQYLIDDLGDTDTESGGARGAIRGLTDEVVTRIAAFVNAHPEERSIYVDIEGTLASDDVNLVRGDARIKVVADR